MRLAEFILSNLEPILREWEGFARTLAPGSALGVVGLRDHAEDILRVTARDMLASQTPEQQFDKATGRGGGGSESAGLDSASNEHAMERLGSGFNLTEVVSEYRALRASVLRLWRDRVLTADQTDLQDLTRFNESIDQSLAEAVRSYTRRVDESRELFLATLGHDLRAPLNAMMLSAELVARSGQLDEDHSRIASQIVNFGGVMTSMIHDLLDFTRSRLGGGMPVSLAHLDLGDLCNEVLNEFQAAHPDRAIHYESDGDTSGEWDRARMRQVLSNLLANAIAHGDTEAPVHVSVRDDGSDVILSVANQGPAIEASAFPTLFDPFVRAASRRGREENAAGSFGLGLYIAREIAIAHGGTITVDSSDLEGTTFRVRLPRKPAGT